MPTAALSTPQEARIPVPATSGSAPEKHGAFFTRYDDIRAFVLREWERELDYRLKQELWTYDGDRISVSFEYEWHDESSGRWMRSRGSEQWVIGGDGLIRCLDKQISDDPIETTDA
ncbi:MAG: nuclear transport factor 2 family protein [Paracoccaceae bacterium]|nr:nuclear transport factor 2 family protein [Paracoccaceae bacterium]